MDRRGGSWSIGEGPCCWGGGSRSRGGCLAVKEKEVSAQAPIVEEEALASEEDLVAPVVEQFRSLQIHSRRRPRRWCGEGGIGGWCGRNSNFGAGSHSRRRPRRRTKKVKEINLGYLSRGAWFSWVEVFFLWNKHIQHGSETTRRGQSRCEYVSEPIFWICCFSNYLLNLCGDFAKKEQRWGINIGMSKKIFGRCCCT